MPEPARTSEVGRWRVQHFVQLDSTNRHLLREAASGAATNLVAVADHQTAGRGRLDRRWDAPPGSSLLVTVLLRVRPTDAAFPFVMAVGVALAEAVEAVTGVTVGLKWPNDLLVGDRKLAGLLAEREGDALVVGAGCNVNWESFPPDLADTATACNLEVGHPVDRDALLEAFLRALAMHLDAPDATRAAYRARLVTVGRRVRVDRGDRDAIVGDATGIDADGSLIVRDDAGTEHTILAGDVTHLRNA